LSHDCKMRYRFKFEKGSFPVSDAAPGGYHSCDALVYIPVVFSRPSDETGPQQAAIAVACVDGRREAGEPQVIPEEQMMIIWAAWAMSFAQSKTLPRRLRNLAALVWQGMQQMLGLHATYYEKMHHHADAAAEKKAVEKIKAALEELAREEQEKRE